MIMIAVLNCGVISGAQGADVVVANVLGDAPVEGSAGVRVSVESLVRTGEPAGCRVDDI